MCDYCNRDHKERVCPLAKREWDYENRPFTQDLHPIVGDPMCYDENCAKEHNETGHHYGCACGDCMREYWLLKH
jgi:hypothetical protein